MIIFGLLHHFQTLGGSFGKRLFFGLGSFGRFGVFGRLFCLDWLFNFGCFFGGSRRSLRSRRLFFPFAHQATRLVWIAGQFGVFVQFVQFDDANQFLVVLFVGGVAGFLQTFGPAFVIFHIQIEERFVARTRHQKKRMVGIGIEHLGIFTETSHFAIVEILHRRAVPGSMTFDAEVIVALTRQFTIACARFQQTLRQSDTGRNTILYLLTHGIGGIFLDIILIRFQLDIGPHRQRRRQKHQQQQAFDKVYGFYFFHRHVSRLKKSIFAHQPKVEKMRQVKISAKITYCRLDELHSDEKNAIEAAKKACSSAYAPYSHFHVGAAVLLDNGTIVVGANQENAAYPSGLCAERVALFAAASQYPQQKAVLLAIAACNDKGEFTEHAISPCGACRQVMLETEKRFQLPLKVLLYGASEIVCIESAQDLLPLAFTEAK